MLCAPMSELQPLLSQQPEAKQRTSLDDQHHICILFAVYRTVPQRCVQHHT